MMKSTAAIRRERAKSLSGHSLPQTAQVTLLRGDLQQLANHASHYGNCSLDSWSPRLVRCKCGLFQLLTRLERAGLISSIDRGAL